MDSFTLFILIVVLAAGALGWTKGFIGQISQLIGIILAIAACRIFGDYVTGLIAGHNANDTVIYTVIAYTLLFLAVYIIVWLIAKMLLSAIHVLHVGILNRIGGAIFCICKWMILVSLVLNVYAALVPDTALSASRLYNKTLAFAPWILGSDTAHEIGNTVGKVIKG